MADIEPRLAFDTFAFDARGMGESDGETGYANTEQECDDLGEVLRALLERGETIRSICGHSKGAVVALMYASRPDAVECRLYVAISPRYDARDSSAGVARFSAEQRDELERTGRFVWLHYRCGPEPERPHRRPYVVTREDIARAAERSLECVSNMAEGTSALVLHGKADGTVPYANSVRVDEAIGRGAACSDLGLFDGVGHNWDAPGEDTLLASIIGAWLEQRAKTPARKRTGPLVDHLIHERER